MSKKNADLNEELVEFIQKLYEKYVPSSVQTTAAVVPTHAGVKAVI